MTKRIFLYLVFIALSSNLLAQLGMGQWRTHFAYNTVSEVAQSENKIFAVSDGALFSVNKYDENIEYYSKLSGLNDAEVSTIAYSAEYETLIVVYKNGNIDLMRSGGVENIPDLYNKQMSASKNVNDIFINGNKAYLSCDFGIVVLNVEKNEIADSYFIGPNGSELKILNTTIHNGKIYATTQSALYVADANSPNLVNFENWSTISTLPGSGNIQQIHTFSETLFMRRNFALYKFVNNSWEVFLPGLGFTGINSNADRMLAYNDNSVYQINSNLTHLLICNSPNTLDAVYDSENDLFWFAADDKGVSRYNANNNSSNHYKPNGPLSNIPYRLRFGGEKLFMVQGGCQTSKYNRAGHVMMYEKGEWTNINSDSIQATLNIPIRDFSDIAVHPNDNSHFYVSSYGAGLYEFRKNKFYKLHNTTNSPIGLIINTTNINSYTWTDGLIFDKNNSLWLCNQGPINGVHTLSEDENWSSINNVATSQRTRMREIIISTQKQHFKWVLDSHSSKKGIGCFNDNGTIENQSDDQSVFLNSFHDQDGKELKISDYYTIVEDTNKDIWVGTNAGPFVLSNTEKVFDGGMTCSRIKIPRNDGTNAADYLLENEAIKAIAIDGANRKWIGTEGSGVYLMSANGEETIQHFTAENSPLPSNNILSLAINSKTGEVFIGTASGLVSYQSDAAAGQETMANIYAYPNPVRETYNGLITITGLLENTTVKITDVTGNLICETISNGSIAVWDGKNKFGQRVSTGVYLAICLSEDGTERGITKILFIN